MKIAEGRPLGELVTGASGFVGGALLKRLAADAYCRVVAALCMPLPGLPPPVGTVYLESLTTSDPSSTSWVGADVVAHWAARSHVIKDDVADPLTEFRRVNVDWTLVLARAAMASGIRRFVFVSSVKVNGETT